MPPYHAPAYYTTLLPLVPPVSGSGILLDARRRTACCPLAAATFLRAARAYARAIHAWMRQLHATISGPQHLQRATTAFMNIDTTAATFLPAGLVLTPLRCARGPTTTTCLGGGGHTACSCHCAHWVVGPHTTGQFSPPGIVEDTHLVGGHGREVGGRR